MFDKHIYEIGEYLGMAKLNFMEVHICQRKHVHDIIVNRKHSSYFPYFFIPFLFVYKNLYIISSSIEKFFMSTKTFILNKTEQNYIFHRILFSGHWSKKSFLYPFRSLSSKLFRKFKIRSLRSNCSKSSKGSRGANSLSFLFSFPFNESVFTCKILFSILVKVYLHS